MTVRPTMAHLIAHLRGLIGDEGLSPTFADETLQQTLDLYREEVTREALGPVVVYAADGTAQYERYVAARGFWESDAVIQRSDLSTATPSEADWLAGHFVFAASEPPPLFITGRRYDLWGAAADLLERLVRKMDATDFSLGGDRFERSKQVAALLGMAERYRRRSWRAVGVGVLSRGDAAV